MEVELQFFIFIERISKIWYEDMLELILQKRESCIQKNRTELFPKCSAYDAYPHWEAKTYRHEK